MLAVLLQTASCSPSRLEVEVSADGTMRSVEGTGSSRIEHNNATNTITVHPRDGLYSATVVLMHDLDNIV